LSAALAMVLAAAQQSADQQLPTLHMLVPPGPVERAAAAELIRAWKRVGLDVEIVDQASPEPVAWDLHYRTVQMLEPTLDLWPFLTASTAARVADLEPFPDWLKHGLVTVDRTSDWPRALSAVRNLHEMLWSDVRFVPLWEVDGYLVVRKNVQGFPAVPVRCYQNIDRWTIGAWFRTE